MEKILVRDLRCSFNTQPPEGGCRFQSAYILIVLRFQHTAARRRLLIKKHLAFTSQQFQHTAARRRLQHIKLILIAIMRFQHTAARRRLPLALATQAYAALDVSTHSRPKAAAHDKPEGSLWLNVSTHSRPKAAALIRMTIHLIKIKVSTHSRPKAAAASLKSLAPSGFAALISLSS